MAEGLCAPGAEATRHCLPANHAPSNALCRGAHRSGKAAATHPPSNPAYTDRGSNRIPLPLNDEAFRRTRRPRPTRWVPLSAWRQPSLAHSGSTAAICGAAQHPDFESLTGCKPPNVRRFGA